MQLPSRFKSPSAVKVAASGSSRETDCADLVLSIPPLRECARFPHY